MLLYPSSTSGQDCDSPTTFFNALALLLVVVLPFFWFFRILIAAGLLAHRLHLAARAPRQHGGRWTWR